MKKTRLISMLCAIAMSLTLVLPVGAISLIENTESSLDVSTPTRNKNGLTKADFVEQCQRSSRASGRTAISLTQDEADRLLIEYTTSSSSRKQELEVQLNAAGHFIFSEGTTVETLSEPANVTLSNVVTSYNDNTGDWSLISGGTWNNLDAIKKDAGTWLFAVGSTKNIGGYDAVGMVIYNTSGKTPTLKSSFATINDGTTTKTLYNPSAYDTNRGIAFQYQDVITVTRSYLVTYDFTYMGKGFSSVMRFGSDFVNWNGKARTFYAHTWSDTTINQIAFSVGTSSANFNVSWSENNNHMDIYSNADTSF